MGSTTNSDIRVEATELTRHAGVVRAHADRVGKAAEAANHLSSLDDAYGLLCRQLGLPEKLRQPQEETARSIARLQDMLRRTADNVGQAAVEYQQLEQAHSQQLNGIAAELDTADTLPTLGGGTNPGDVV